MRDMAINFLLFSKSYKEFLKKMRTGVDHGEMGNLACSCLADDYLPAEGMTLKKITAIVHDGGIDVDLETIRKLIKMIQLTRRFFMAKEGERKEILKQVNTGDKYKDYFGIGIKCLLEDGITKWEQILSLMKNETMPKKEETVLVSVKQKIAQKQVVVMTTSEDEDVDMVSQRVDEAKSLLEDSCEKFVQIITKIKAEHNQNKQKLVACFDQLRELNGTGDIARGLKETLTQKEILFQEITKERDFFREEIGKLEKENVGLREDKELSALLLEESEKKLKDFQIQVLFLQKRIEELDKDGILAKKILALVQEQSPLSAQPLPIQAVSENKSENENWEENLPRIYAPTKVGVKFNKSFLSSLNKVDKQLLDATIVAIINICENGINKVSLKKKPMSMPSSTGISPAGCTQIKIMKKFRFTLKTYKDRIEFFEFYNRDKSPFCGGNKKTQPLVKH